MKFCIFRRFKTANVNDVHIGHNVHIKPTNGWEF